MALLAHRLPQLRTIRRKDRRLRVALLAALGMAMVSSAEAQIMIGSYRPPSVTVDLSVLDRLGTAPTLPQLFLALRQPAATATVLAAPPIRNARANPAARRIVLHPPTTRLGGAAPAPTGRGEPTTPRVARASGSSKSPIIHLVPPASRVADKAVAHDEVAVAQPTQPSVAALAPPPPAPMPALPRQDETPTPPVVSPAPVHEEAPKPTVQPPPEATAAQTAKPPQDAAAVQVASAASAGVASDAIKFAPGLTDLPPDSRAILDTLAAKLAASDALRVQLIAHATGTDAQAVEARRISLARAIAVRSYLISKGVHSLRVDVRALGNRADDGPATDQVNLVLVNQ